VGHQCIILARNNEYPCSRLIIQQIKELPQLVKGILYFYPMKSTGIYNSIRNTVQTYLPGARVVLFGAPVAKVIVTVMMTS